MELSARQFLGANVYACSYQNSGIELSWTDLKTQACLCS